MRTKKLEFKFLLRISRNKEKIFDQLFWTEKLWKLIKCDVVHIQLDFKLEFWNELDPLVSMQSNCLDFEAKMVKNS